MPSVDQYSFKGEQRFDEIARLYEELKSHGIPVDYWVSSEIYLDETDREVTQ